MADNNIQTKTGIPVVLPNISQTWTSYSSVVSNGGSKTWTVIAKYRQYMDSVEIAFNLSANSVASGVGGAFLSFSLPSGLTVNTSALLAGIGSANSANVQGFAQGYGTLANGQFDRSTAVVVTSTTTLGFLKPGSNTAYTTGDFNNAWAFEFDGFARVPVNEYLTTAYLAYGAGLATSVKAGLVTPRKGETALIVNCGQAGFATTRAIGIYYQDQDGAHRLKFNTAANFTSASVTTLTLAITGVVFKNVHHQACAAAFGTSLVVPRALALQNTANIQVATTSSVSADGVFVSGDVELDSKPSWA